MTSTTSLCSRNKELPPPSNTVVLSHEMRGARAIHQVPPQPFLHSEGGTTSE